ncbi:CAP domain-containing protein [Halobacillus naozhouensis]|uniref:CAP domain-containing protein n=1 Tax=Halobacillus naozhouensis TaxID=554880 RepID=A0ABY8IZM0_9BACI|nr:CAP domain-containing protein [Halobacillus naozhouensis]WFT74633.1 CAP domain-containing protein [Halobacillus naozhouensis]
MFKRLSIILVTVLAIVSFTAPSFASEQKTWTIEQVDSFEEWTNQLQRWLSEQNFEFSKERFEQNFKILFNPEQIPMNQQPQQTGKEQPAEQPASEPSQVPAEVIEQATSSYEEKVVQLVNEERAKEGLSPLKMHDRLSDLARMKSQDMADKGYFSHTSPTYGSPFDMMQQYNFSYSAAGENIAAGQRTPQEVVEGWMNSPGHRANIMNEHFTHIGVGYVEGGSYGTYWTQLFMNPR